jgi:hypothetical protein
VIEQAPGRRDDDLRAGAQGADLRIEPDTAIDGGRADRVLGAIGPDALLDLEGELPCRRQDQGTNDPCTARSRRVQALHHGQDEGGRLAGPGLGTGEQVATRENEWD